MQAGYPQFLICLRFGAAGGWGVAIGVSLLLLRDGAPQKRISYPGGPLMGRAVGCEFFPNHASSITVI